MSWCLCVSLLVILVKNKATHAPSYVSMAACWVQLWHDYSTVISIDIVAQQCLPLLLPGWAIISWAFNFIIAVSYFNYSWCPWSPRRHFFCSICYWGLVIVRSWLILIIIDPWSPRHVSFDLSVAFFIDDDLSVACWGVVVTERLCMLLKQCIWHVAIR